MPRTSSESKTKKTSRRSSKKKSTSSIDIKNIIWPVVGFTTVLILMLISLTFGLRIGMAGSSNLVLNPAGVKFEEQTIEKTPVVTDLNPANPIVGQNLTITGRNLGWEGGQVNFWRLDTENEMWVNFGTADIVRWSDTSVEVLVPEINPFDTEYFIQVGVREMLGGPLFPAAWEVNNQVLVLPDFREYVVVEGDSIFKVARKVLGDESRYNEIIQLNLNQYPNFAQFPTLSPGMILRVPSK